MSPSGLNRGDGEVTLVERLRAYDPDPGKTAWEAADTIEALVEALEPFAERTDYVDALGYDDGDYVDCAPFTAGDFRQARTALSLVRTGK